MNIHVADSAASGTLAPASSELVQQNDSDATRAEVLRLAQEFEALLLTQMLKDMRRSMVGDESDNSEFGALTSTMDTELARALSASGGFGLSGVLIEALDRLAGAATVAAPTSGLTAGLTPGATSMAAALQSAVEDRPDALVGLERTDVAGPVTSEFGWRRDPMTGARAFHAGVDIGMAYGRDIHVVADGRVSFAGENGGYGNMVTVDHPDGTQTRYAHLAEHQVRVGDVLTAGQVLGKSGSSGRATGPHLHFEVRVNGEPVNPLRTGEEL